MRILLLMASLTFASVSQAALNDMLGIQVTVQFVDENKVEVEHEKDVYTIRRSDLRQFEPLEVGMPLYLRMTESYYEGLRARKKPSAIRKSS